MDDAAAEAAIAETLRSQSPDNQTPDNRTADGPNQTVGAAKPAPAPEPTAPLPSGPRASGAAAAVASAAAAGRDARDAPAEPKAAEPKAALPRAFFVCPEVGGEEAWCYVVDEKDVTVIGRATGARGAAPRGAARLGTDSRWSELLHAASRLPKARRQRLHGCVEYGLALPPVAQTDCAV
jgi:hypothetical protein